MSSHFFYRRLNLRLFASILAATWLALPSLAISNSGSGDLKKNISTTDAVAKKIINSLPESSVKSGLLRYYEILKPEAYNSDAEVATQNLGLVKFFENQFAGNSCYAERALLFYHDLKSSTRQNQTSHPKDSRNSRPSLGDAAGSNRKDLAPGWLFKKALKFTNNDPNKALSLIALCGHDDQQQGSFENSNAEQTLTDRGMKLNELYSIDEDEEYQRTPCPKSTADFYISKSLSKDTDISENLKKRILRIQYPNKKFTDVPSKNYHILGAAFMTCQMIEAGLSPFLAIQTQIAAANLYRGIRLCQEVDDPSQLFRRLMKDPRIRQNYINKSYEDSILTLSVKAWKAQSCSRIYYHQDAICDLIASTGLPFLNNSFLSEDRFKESLQKTLEKVIASGLYTSWSLPEEIAGFHLPCSKSQLFGPHPFLKWLVTQGRWPLNICGHGLKPETCKKALEKIKTWEVDFDWTISQHRVGAQFAAKVCRSKPHGQSSFNQFCD